jgi:N-acetyl-alpha-D-muramate 1-phosphate uridylyltransferase
MTPSISGQENLKAMILAAGRGERLMPLTKKTPKPLMQINGESLLARHLKQLKLSGFAEVVINTSYLGQMIEETIGQGKSFGLTISYSREPTPPLETAGAVVRALPLLGSEPFLLVNGDIWTDIKFNQLKSNPNYPHLVLVPNPKYNLDGDFNVDGPWVVKADENPYTYSGIGIYPPAFFSHITNERQPLGPMLFTAAKKKSVQCTIYDGQWFDIGTISRLAYARRKTILSKTL